MRRLIGFKFPSRCQRKPIEGIAHRIEGNAIELLAIKSITRAHLLQKRRQLPSLERAKSSRVQSFLGGQIKPALGRRLQFDLHRALSSSITLWTSRR